MTIADNIQEIEKLQEIEIPWEVKRAIPNLQLFGGQICFGGEGDFLSLKESQEVVKWLSEQLQLTSTSISLSLSRMKLSKDANITSSQRKQIQKIIRRMKKEVKQHFEEHGWDLDISTILSEFYNEVFQVDFWTYVVSNILPKDCYITSSDKKGIGMVIRREEG